MNPAVAEVKPAQNSNMICPQPFLQAGLTGSLKRIQKKNPRVSLRTFAKRLGISHPALSEILKGKRRVSKDKAECFAEALKISGAARKAFLNDFNKVDPVYEVLPDNVFQVLADPDYFHLLTLVDTIDFTDSTAWMANRLGISQEKAQQIFQTLQELKLVEMGPEGKWVPTNNRVSTPNNIASKAIRKSHELSLAKASEALHNVSVDKRFFLSAAMSTDKEKYEIATGMLRDTLNKISELFETSGKEEVYKLQIALFPVTKLPEDRGSSC